MFFCLFFQGFKMYFKQTEFGCGGQVRLSMDEPELTITSLNYPNVPPAHAECVWHVVGKFLKDSLWQYQIEYYLQLIIFLPFSYSSNRTSNSNRFCRTI